MGWEGTKAVLARKRACTPVLNSSFRSRALVPESVVPSPWLHWALLSSCLPQENWHGPRPLTLKQPGWLWDSTVSSMAALVNCVLWAYPEHLTSRFWWQLCGSDVPWVTQTCEIQAVQCPQSTGGSLSTRDLHWGLAASLVHYRVIRAAGASAGIFQTHHFFIHLFPPSKWKLFFRSVGFLSSFCSLDQLIIFQLLLLPVLVKTLLVGFQIHLTCTSLISKYISRTANGTS